MAMGSFNSQQHQMPTAEINMTPLVDVMLVLVGIFILTAPLMVSTVKVELPQTQGANADEPPKAMMLVVDKAGQVYVNDRPVDMAALAQAPNKTGQGNPSTEVPLKADTAVPYGRVVEVMGLAHQAGLSRIGFVADPGAPADH